MIEKRSTFRKHLRRLDRILLPDFLIYFITITSYRRRRILTDEVVAESIIDTFEKSEEIHGWAVGHYMIMPDHVHFFCSNITQKKELSQYIQDFKKWTTRMAHESDYHGNIWQKEFFDHLIRSSESYSEKLDYVFLNPVRAGLCEDSEQWPFRGVVTDLG